MSDQFRGLQCNLDGEIVLDSLILVNTTGAFCDLFTASHPTAGKLALKRPRGDCYDQGVIARIEIEASVWTMLRHPRILQFLGISKIGEKIYLVSPFAENGSLPGFLSVRPDVDRRRLVIEIAEGLAYLHQHAIIHGDLKGNNILISGDEHVRICDFGLAKHVTSRTSTSLRGTGSIPWQSPELLRDASRRTYESDVYAFGITVYEVLSGKEPYVNYSGIGSIIAGVLFSAERPPKEPLAALDGTSYLQLWNEASRCWDEDPALRPSIASVLTRLDHERAEEWITAQQIALETSLNPSFDIGLMSRSAPISDGQLALAQMTDTTETLRWAEGIRSRLTTFVNSKQAISRMTPELLAAIILRDDTDVRLRNSHPLSTGGSFSLESRYLESRIRRMFRSVQLRRVSRAWRLAIDTSSQLCDFVWVDPNEGNVEYILQRNPDGPLECVVSATMAASLLPILQPLTHRISYMSTTSPSDCVAELLKALTFPKLIKMHCTRQGAPWPWITIQRSFISLNPGTNSLMGLVLEEVPFEVFQPAVFAFLRTIKIIESVAHDTFIADLFAVLQTNPNLTELVLVQLRSGHELKTSPPSRVTHRGLQKMRLIGIPSPILSALLLHLDTENLLALVIYGIEPSQLAIPDSAFVKTIRSLPRAVNSPEDNGELWLSSAVRPDENALMLRWSAVTRADDKPPDDNVWDSWDFNTIQTSHTNNLNAIKLFHVLLDLGIQVDSITLDTNSSGGHGGEVLDRSLGFLSPDSQSWLEILTLLESVKRMTIGVGVLGAALKHLSEPIPTTVGGSEYVCPHLRHLAVRAWVFKHWQEDPSMFQEHIGRRQQAADSLNGPTRLKKIGVPAAWIDQIKGDDPIFEGVEIYSTGRW